MKTPGQNRKLQMIAGFLLIAVLSGVVLWVGGRIPIRHVEVEYGHPISVSLFFWGKAPADAKMIPSNPSDALGVHTVEIVTGGKTTQCTYEILDVTNIKVEILSQKAWVGVMPKPADYVKVIAEDPKMKVKVAWKKLPDVTRQGEQTCTVLLTDTDDNSTAVDIVLDFQLDETPPVIQGVKDLLCYSVDLPYTKYMEGVSIVDDLDEHPKISVEAPTIDPEKTAEYEICYVAVDAAGNRSVKSCKLKVICDRTAPHVEAEDFFVYLGNDVVYEEHVQYEDCDPAPKLTVDDTKVNLNRVGKYPVTYIVTDCSGNETRKTVILRVKNVPTEGPNEDYVMILAERCVQELITEDMNDAQKLHTIYGWIRANMRYRWGSDKTSWAVGAYDAFQNHYGDCFNYYSLTKALLTAAGIDNACAERRSANGGHYWNLVRYKGQWYHMDVAPFAENRAEVFLLTDQELSEWDAACGWNAHRLYQEGIPPRATQSVQQEIAQLLAP